MKLWLKDTEQVFVYDKETKKLYQITGNDADEIKPSLEQIGRFRPMLRVYKETKTFENLIVHNKGK